MRQVAQQWTGINVILYYAATLFASMGIDEGSASTSLVIANALLLCAGTVPGMLLVEHRWAVRAPCPCPCMLDKARHTGAPLLHFAGTSGGGSFSSWEASP